MISEGEEIVQRVFERRQAERHFSYEMTQKLTFFVVGAELVFCGYILLNAEKLGPIEYSSILFPLAGMAAVMGLVWRAVFNDLHLRELRDQIIAPGLAKILRATYVLYIFLSAAFFFLLLFAGTMYLFTIGADHPKVWDW